MKKLLFLIPLLLFSCKKEAAVEILNSDSLISTDQNTVVNPKDTFALKDSNSLEKPKVEAAKANSESKVLEGNKIIQTIDASKIPISINEEFTNDDQQLIIKIENFKGSKITGNIVPQNEMMNIRFNQIKLADGEFDGPFGRDISYVIKKSGEIWLLISKSNMASEKATGKFTVSLK